MQKNFLREVVSFIVGKTAEDIVDFLDGKKYINEFLIAKKLNLTVNQVRNLLYKLSYQGIVSYIKKKDKRKGWYTFFWRIEILKALELLERILLKRGEEIKHQIKSRELKLFYVCDKCGIEFSEETALVYDFTCQECGNVFNIKDNTQMLKDYHKSMHKTEEELKEVRKELAIEKEKIGKIEAKKAKREAKEKITKRKKARDKKKRDKELIEEKLKKNLKKSIKKSKSIFKRKEPKKQLRKILKNLLKRKNKVRK